jgi:hypothetical protein
LREERNHDDLFGDIMTFVVRSLVACAIAVMMCQPLHADIAGIINSYYAVTAIGAAGCVSYADVRSSTGLSPNDRVLVIQMNGAEARRTEDASYGVVTDMGGAGLWEIATVASVTPTRVVLRERLRNQYNTLAAVQLVRIHTGTNERVHAPVLAQPWNGSTGGVIAIELTGTLTLDNEVNASSCGFRGGIKRSGGSPCSAMLFAAPATNNLAAQKGESHATPGPNDLSGRGAFATAGGGGVSHNSGGGGGANAGAGGQGGNEYAGCTTTANNGGLGGWAVADALLPPRLLMGGGGGAGHQNNTAATDGGAGGGIVVVLAAEITGTSALRADGTSISALAGNDAAGGAGAGGTVWVSAPSMTGQWDITIRGGTGGSVRTGVPHGTGGGGGGGWAVSTARPFPTGVVSIARAGGAPGENVLAAGALRQYRATAGRDGIVLQAAAVPFALVPDPPVVLAAGDTTVCPGDSVRLSAMVTGGIPPLRVEWFTSNNDYLGGGFDIATTWFPPYRAIVRVTDGLGCEATDTVLVGRKPTARLDVADCVLGARGRCGLPFDTVVIVVNKGLEAIAVSSVAATGTSVQVSPGPLPRIIEAGDSLLIPVRLVELAGGSARLRVSAGRCDTLVDRLIRWTEDRAVPRVQPSSLIIGPVGTCEPITIDTALAVTVEGGPATIVGVLGGTCAGLSLPANPSVVGGRITRVPVRIFARGAVQCSVAVVLSYGGCLDTVWIPVEVRSAVVPLELLDSMLPTRWPCTRGQSVPVRIRNAGSEGITVERVEADPPLVIDTMSVPFTLSSGATHTLAIRVLGPGPRAALRVFVRGCPEPIMLMTTWPWNDQQLLTVDTLVNLGDVTLCEAATLDTSFTFETAADSIQVTRLDLAIGTPKRTTAYATAGTRVTIGVQLSAASQLPMQYLLEVRNAFCTDTVTVTIQGRIRSPRMELRIVDVPAVLTCADTTVTAIAVANTYGDTLLIRGISTSEESTIRLKEGDVIVDGDTIAMDVFVRGDNVTAGCTLTVGPCYQRVPWTVGVTVNRAELAVGPALLFPSTTVGTVSKARSWVRNTGTTNLVIPGLTCTDSTVAILQPAQFPITLTPGEEAVVEAQWTSEPGSLRATVRVAAGTSCGPEPVLDVRADVAVETAVRIPNGTADAGDRVTIPLILDRVPDVIAARLRRWKATLEIDPSVISVTEAAGLMDSLFNRGRLQRTVEVFGEWTGGDTLAHIPATILLTTAERTPLRFRRPDGFQWLDVRSGYMLQDGELLLDNVCADRTRRVVLIDGRLQSAEVRAGLIPGTVMLDVRTDYQAERIVVDITSLAGTSVRSTSGTSNTPLMIPLVDQPAGWYGAVVHCGSQVAIVPFLYEP